MSAALSRRCRLHAHAAACMLCHCAPQQLRAAAASKSAVALSVSGTPSIASMMAGAKVKVSQPRAARAAIWAGDRIEATSTLREGGGGKPRAGPAVRRESTGLGARQPETTPDYFDYGHTAANSIKVYKQRAECCCIWAVLAPALAPAGASLQQDSRKTQCCAGPCAGRSWRLTALTLG